MSVVIPDNVPAVRKILMDDKCCTNEMIQKKLNIGFAAIRKTIHEKLHIKKKVTVGFPFIELSSEKRTVSEFLILFYFIFC